MNSYESWNLFLLGLQTLIIGIGGCLAWTESTKWRQIRKSDESRSFKKLYGRLLRTNVDLFHKAAQAYQGQLKNGLQESFLREQDEILYEFDKFIREHYVIYPKLKYFLQEKITDRIREIRPEINRVCEAIQSGNKEFAERILNNNFNKQNEFIDKILEYQGSRLNNYFEEEVD